MPETLTTCPVCLSNKFQQFLELRDIPAHYYDLCQCGAAFLNPRPDDAEQRNFYASGAYRERVAQFDPGLKDSALQIQERARYIANGLGGKFRSHLDIGSSSGELLREVRKTHPNLVSAGVDTDPVFKQDEFPVHPSVEDVPGTWDLITIIQTLEHINQPRPFITAVYDHLTVGGSVLIEVPNRRAAMFAYAPPQHVIAYDEQSLRKLLIGFKNINVSLHGQPQHSPLDLNILVAAWK